MLESFGSFFKVLLVSPTLEPERPGAAWESSLFSLKLLGDSEVQPLTKTTALGCELLESKGHVPAMFVDIFLLCALLPTPPPFLIPCKMPFLQQEVN